MKHICKYFLLICLNLFLFPPPSHAAALGAEKLVDEYLASAIKNGDYLFYAGCSLENGVAVALFRPGKQDGVIFVSHDKFISAYSPVVVKDRVMTVDSSKAKYSYGAENFYLDNVLSQSFSLVKPYENLDIRGKKFISSCSPAISEIKKPSIESKPIEISNPKDGVPVDPNPVKQEIRDQQGHVISKMVNGKRVLINYDQAGNPIEVPTK